MSTPRQISVATLAQAITDGMSALALTVARQTSKGKTIDLLTRYQSALASTGKNDAGAQLVGEMARVVGEIKE
jgi:hypothetical protein